MQLTTTHGISALRITDGQDPELLRYSTATDAEQLTELLAEFRTAYADRADVRIDVTG
ncbi:hypothetical protein [Streptomyces sp. 2P-4]|uniref:hypothetical protein n=1 Tax=Streptomyces sp. 2P-4 TaxID=2931974 RepID=UPI002541560D|nr:hypothetical protein [Streptomyces sp. 2P-4]